MKRLKLIIFFTLQSILFYGQSSFDGNWISDNLEYLSIKDSLIQLETKRRTIHKFDILKKDTLLVFQQHYTTSRNEKLYSKYSYKAIFKNDSLILTKIETIGRDVYKPKDNYRFINEKAIKPENIKFQSISFKATSCYGRCPEMTIKIDSIGAVLFRGEKNTDDIVGNFIGKLNESQFKKLTTILKNSELDKFPNFLGSAMDVPTYYFTFRYNDKVKNSIGYKIPYYNRKLLEYLLTIYKDITLERVDYEIKYDD